MGRATPGAEAESAATMAAWFRHEPPRTPPAVPPATAPRGPAVERVLIGQAAGVAEARIRIGAGVLAGAEIRLTTAAGSRAVEAQLLTRSAGSRQTLAVAMDELRLRLRGRGISLVRASARPGDPALREQKPEARPGDEASRGGAGR